MSDRIRHAGLRGKRMPADEAAALIRPGMTVAMSGFTGAGYPKAIPQALAAHILQAHDFGEEFRIRVLTAPRPRPNSTACWPACAAWNCACRISPILRCAIVSLPAI